MGQPRLSGPTEQLRLMTWNIWGRLNQAPQYIINNKTARRRTIDNIIESNADIIAMVETYGSAQEIAEALDFHYYTPSAQANLAIFSRYPLSKPGTPSLLSSGSFIGVTAELPGGSKVRIYDIWLTSAGRHIVKIKDEELLDLEFCAGDDIRHAQLQEFLGHSDLGKFLADEDMLIIVAGDFNSVSHLDYTAKTKSQNLNFGRILPIKASIAMEQSGFIDSYRFVHPKITSETLGYTWTTVGRGFTYEEEEGFVPVEKNPEPEYQDPYARIDFIYCRGKRIKPVAAQTITHHVSNKTRSFPEFPSDHAAVVTTFEVKSSTSGIASSELITGDDGIEAAP